MANVLTVGWSSIIRRPREGMAVHIMLRFIIALGGYELCFDVSSVMGLTYWSHMLESVLAP